MLSPSIKKLPLKILVPSNNPPIYRQITSEMRFFKEKTSFPTLTLPPYAVRILQELSTYHQKSYIRGGFVRDSLRAYFLTGEQKNNFHDIDFVTTASEEILTQCFGNNFSISKYLVNRGKIGHIQLENPEALSKSIHCDIFFCSGKH